MPAKPTNPRIGAGYSTYLTACALNEGVGAPLDLVTGRGARPNGPGVPPQWTATGFNPAGYTAGPSLRFRQGDGALYFRNVSQYGPVFPRMTAVLFKHDHDTAQDNPYMVGRGVNPSHHLTLDDSNGAFNSGFHFAFGEAGFSHRTSLVGFGWRAGNNETEVFGSTLPTRGQWYLAACLETSKTARHYWLYDYAAGSYLYDAASTSGTQGHDPGRIFVINPGYSPGGSSPAFRTFPGEYGGHAVDNDTYSTDGAGANKSMTALVADAFQGMRGTYTSSSGTLTSTSVDPNDATVANPTFTWSGIDRVDGLCPLMVGGVTPYTYQWHLLDTPDVATIGGGTAISGATSSRYALDPASHDVTKYLACKVTDSAGSPATFTSAPAPARGLRGFERVAMGGNSLVANGLYQDFRSVGLRHGLRCSTMSAGVGGSDAEVWAPGDASGYWDKLVAEAQAQGCTQIRTWVVENLPGLPNSLTKLVAAVSAMADDAAAKGMELWVDGPVTPAEFGDLPIYTQARPALQAAVGAHPNLHLGTSHAMEITAQDSSQQTDGIHPPPTVNVALVRDAWESSHQSLIAATYASAADVRFGTDRGDGATGTLRVPSAAQVLSGVLVDATTGTVVLPSAATVLSTATYGPASGTTGTYVVPATSVVKVGATYGVAAGSTGTYDGTDRNGDPGVANVRAGTAYKANSTTNNRTGTLALPVVTDVKATVQYGAAGTEFTGSLAVSGATYLAANLVKVGVDRGDATLGTYDGSDRWSDPGVANVLSTAAAYKANSTTTNRTGTYVAPAANQVISTATFGAGGATAGTVVQAPAGKVESGYAYGPGSSLTGTLVVSGGGTFPAAAQVLLGVAFGPTANLTGTVTLPAANKVLTTATYGPSLGTTGTVVLPTAGQVESGVTFGPGSGTTGTLDTAGGGSGEFPSVDEIAAAVIGRFEANGTKLAQAWAAVVGDSDTVTAPGSVIFKNQDGSESHRQTYNLVTGRGAPTLGG